MTRIAQNHKQPLATSPHQAYLFSSDDVQAIEAALDAQRPLLLRGEPGCGKSQLAKAAAMALKWNFTSFTVDALTEPSDLLWSEDAVSRLAEAQMAAVGGLNQKTVRRCLKRTNFITPGPLWKGFAWPNSADQKPNTIVLIDEIDKADSAVPNGLLEALGNGCFRHPSEDRLIKATKWPLVIITTNEERSLPNAFLRRCIVHHMGPDENNLQTWFTDRAKVNFPDWENDDILTKAAEATIKDRQQAQKDHLYPLPGLAEYLDLLRALAVTPDRRFDRLDQIKKFFLQKQKLSSP
jgi:MoxR-like ATPase